MNLHAITSGAIGAVNPMVPMTVQVSLGSTTDASGRPTPSYAPERTVMGQVQPLAWRDLQMTDGIVLQGVRRKIYLSGHVEGLVRATNKGGDLITAPDGSVWLVALILEAWPRWTCAAVTLQNGS